MSFELVPLSERRSSNRSDTTKANESRCSILSFACVAAVLVATVASFVAVRLTTKDVATGHPPTMALAGNSMLYHNDCPRLVEILLKGMMHDNIPSLRLQDSCLRGGANLNSLWTDGNGMESRFGSSVNNINGDVGASTVESMILDTAQNWDFVVLQDDTIDPVMDATKQISVQTLTKHYLPTMLKLKPPPTVLLLQPFPFQSPRERERLGLHSAAEFARALDDGYRDYARVVRDAGVRVRIVPMAGVVASHGENMYDRDGAHPSPHATWLQSCLLVAVATFRAPPRWEDDIRSEWLRRARYWQSPSQESLPLPTEQEAELLRQLACHMANDILLHEEKNGEGDNYIPTPPSDIKMVNGACQ